MDNTIAITSKWETKLAPYERYQVTEMTETGVAVTRIEKSDLAIKIDWLVETLKLPFLFVNTILEDEFIKLYEDEWRISKKGILWFTTEEFYLNFNEEKVYKNLTIPTDVIR